MAAGMEVLPLFCFPPFLFIHSGPNGVMVVVTCVNDTNDNVRV